MFVPAARALNDLGIAFLELRELSPTGTFGATEVPKLSPKIRQVFSRPLILNQDYTFEAASADVASGLADVAFGVEAAARQFGLDFVRLLTEDYVFVCHKQILDLPAMQRVLAVMRGQEFHTAISQLPGYRVKEAGAIKTIREVFRKSE